LRARSAACTNILRAALNWAERLDLIVRNPPAPTDVVRMITEASKQLAVFLRLGALTGGRRDQLCGLRWSDVDLDAATLRWTRSLRKFPGGTVDMDTKMKAQWSVSLDRATVELLRAPPPASTRHGASSRRRLIL
jgi:integrase